MTSLSWALFALTLPAGIAGLLAILVPLRRHGWPAAWLSVGGAAASFLFACFLLASQLDNPSAVLVHQVPWLSSGGVPLAEVGLRLDGISSSMLVVVTFVALCVQVFSLGYMSSEAPPSLGRYFTYHSLFLFSMNLLVLAPNLLQLFVGWELVGMTSYLLIGFYYQKPGAARAAVKAFWVTKLADIGLLVALILVRASSGGFGWEAVLPASMATAVTLLLYAAVIGKSAQLPLHVWLPDAMAGPTPVSALLHAATMVAAGVFLVVRASPLFVQAPVTSAIMAHAGAATALFAAVLALFQSDLKRVLAYSTCSQLGYMLAGLGAGSVHGGFFHLSTHAFFKALLFLAAGSVIHAVHSNEISRMGGLWRKMPVTTVVFLIGALSLSGIPGLAGFFSKDLILETVHAQGLLAVTACLLVAGFLTAFYMGRVIFLAFFGAPSADASHAHESGLSMLLPLFLLAVPSLCAGFFGSTLAGLMGASYHFHLGTVSVVASLVAVAGLLLSYHVFGRKGASAGFPAALEPARRLAESRAFDRLYERAYQGMLLRFSSMLGWFDRYVVDGLMNAVGALFVSGGERLRVLQTGNAQDYVFVLALGVAALATWGVWP
ncbi:MAG: NADH-quinone oxidoreductase subunit L [Deltaproteobacteria bacterium]|nr:NADH-quinone oxidoreductase subunit L [Deltaproteobacteria bacterium]